MIHSSGSAVSLVSTEGDGAPAVLQVGGRLPEWLPRWEIIAAVLLVIGSVYLSKVVMWLLARPVGRRFERAGVQRVVLGSARTLTVAAAVAVAAVLLGLDAGNVLLSVTVISAVIGVVLAPIARSVLAGMLVLVDRPFAVGDFVELDTGERGFVDEITIRYTRIYTLENAYVLLSNSEIREREITNYTAGDRRTRLSLRVQVPYEDDLGEARRIMEEAARDCQDVIDGGPQIRVGRSRYPAAPTCYVEEFADSGVVLNLRFWTTEPSKMLTVRSTIRTQVLSALDDAGIDIPYPHTHHVFDETSGRAKVTVDAEPETPAKARAATDGGEPSDAGVPETGIGAAPRRRDGGDEAYDPGIRVRDGDCES